MISPVVCPHRACGSSEMRGGASSAPWWRFRWPSWCGCVRGQRARADCVPGLNRQVSSPLRLLVHWFPGLEVWLRMPAVIVWGEETGWRCPTSQIPGLKISDLKSSESRALIWAGSASGGTGWYILMVKIPTLGRLFARRVDETDPRCMVLRRRSGLACSAWNSAAVRCRGFAPTMSQNSGGILLLIPLHLGRRESGDAVVFSFVSSPPPVHPAARCSGSRPSSPRWRRCCRSSWLWRPWLRPSGVSDPADWPLVLAIRGCSRLSLLLLVGSFLLFLVAFARSEAGNPGLRRAAVVGAVGAAVSTIMVVIWVGYLRFPELVDWYPAISGSLASRLTGLAAAGALIWFLETFATTYDEDDDPVDYG